MRWMKPAMFALLLVGLPIGCSAMCSNISASYMTGYVPEKFGLTKAYSEGTCVNDIFVYVGAFAVGLDAQTVRDIEELGIRYFDDIGGPRDRNHGVHFRDWKETPPPASALSGEEPNNFHCGKQYSGSWPSGFREALEVPGSFYSDDLRGRSAVVVPSLGIIAISMETR